jgi:hypothetical protein
MKRAVNETLYFGLLGLALAGLYLTSHLREVVLIAVGAAIGVYVVATVTPLRWALPRRRRHVPSIAVCFLGALLVALATRDPEGQRVAATWVAAVVGAFGFLFAAVKTGVPTHVGILVNTQSVSAHREDGIFDVDRGRRIAQAMYDLGLLRCPAFVDGDFGVWPEHFEISQEGSITWFINGPPGTSATIRFDRGFDPFSEPDGRPSVFHATVPERGPGIAVAGPVVSPGRGAYSIQIETPGQAVRNFIVHGGGSQRKG